MHAKPQKRLESSGMSNRLANVPAVHRVLACPQLGDAIVRHGVTLVRDAVRDALAEVRLAIHNGLATPGIEAVAGRALEVLADRTHAAYPEVINATGVLIHTNLGRAPTRGLPPTGYLALEARSRDRRAW